MHLCGPCFEMLVEAEYVSEELMWETVVNVKAFVAPSGSCCAIAIISSFTTGMRITNAFDFEGNTIRSRRHQYWYLPTYNPVYPSSQINQEQYKMTMQVPMLKTRLNLTVVLSARCAACASYAFCS